MALQLCPDRIDKVVLMASDGLRFNSFYFFLTRTYPGKRLFNHFLTKPKTYFPLIDWMRDRKVIDQNRHSFAMWYLQTESTRAFLLKVWPCLRKLVPSQIKLRKVIAAGDKPVHIFMGKHDKIIPVRLAEKFKGKLKSVHLYVLDKGHRVMDEDSLPEICARIKD